MGLPIGLVTNQGQNPGTGSSGPPFPLNSAFNGVSVDTGTGQIVWGNDLGLDAAGPAALVSDREIWVQNFNSFLKISAARRMIVRGDGINIENDAVATNLVSDGGVTLNDLVASALSVYTAQQLTYVNVSGFQSTMSAGGFTVADGGGANESASLTNQQLAFTDNTFSTSVLGLQQLNITDVPGVAIMNLSSSALTMTLGGDTEMHMDSTLVSFHDITTTNNRVDVGNSLVRLYNDTLGNPDTTIQKDSFVQTDPMTAFSTSLTAGMVDILGDGGTKGLRVTTAGVGANSFANLTLTNGATPAQIFLTALSYTNVPYIGAAALGVYTPGAGGVAVTVDNAAGNIRFAVGGVALANEIMRLKTTAVNITAMGVFATNALALAGGLVVGDLYRNAAGVVSCVF